MRYGRLVGPLLSSLAVWAGCGSETQPQSFPEKALRSSQVIFGEFAHVETCSVPESPGFDIVLYEVTLSSACTRRTSPEWGGFEEEPWPFCSHELGGKTTLVVAMWERSGTTTPFFEEEPLNGQEIAVYGGAPYTREDIEMWDCSSIPPSYPDPNAEQDELGGTNGFSTVIVEASDEYCEGPAADLFFPSARGYTAVAEVADVRACDFRRENFSAGNNSFEELRCWDGGGQLDAAKAQLSALYPGPLMNREGFGVYPALTAACHREDGQDL